MLEEKLERNQQYAQIEAELDQVRFDERTLGLTEFEQNREQLEKDMDDILDEEWEKTKGQIREEWEK